MGKARMKRLLRLGLFCISLIAQAGAENAIVKSNGLLRTKASSSSNAIATLMSPAASILINPAARNG